MVELVDVLIVGGGPAGLASGIVLAQAGLDVVLFEKKIFPIDKACGEGIMPTGVRVLESLGVRVVQAKPFFGIRYLCEEDLCAEGSFSNGFGLGVRRTVLSEALHQRAAQFRNLKIVHHQIDYLGRSENCVETRAGEHHYRAPLIIGADGLRSFVRDWAGLSGPVPKTKRYGLRQHFAARPWTDCVEVYLAEDAEAYVTPVAEQEVAINFLWHKERLQLKGRENRAQAMLDRFGNLREKLKDARQLTPSMAIGPLFCKATSSISNNLVLLGDSAGYVDPLTGEGVSLALSQAMALKNTVVPLIKSKKPLTAKNLKTFQRAQADIKRGYLLTTRVALWMSKHPKLARQAIRFLAKNPEIFRSLLSLNMGILRSEYAKL